MNNAGVDASGKDVADLTADMWDRAIRTNLYGAFFCCHHYVRLRKAAGTSGGKIINVTSVHEEIPNAGGSDYDCSKGAVRNLPRTLALELAPLRINVNNLAPGMVLTPFNQEAIDDPEVLDQQVQSIPFKGAAKPVRRPACRRRAPCASCSGTATRRPASSTNRATRSLRSP